MEELAVSMSLSVPELKMSPVEPSTMKRMLSSPSEPIRGVEETVRLPERMREDPEEEAYELNPPWSVASPTVRRVPEVETAPLPAREPSTEKVPETNTPVVVIPTAMEEGA